MLAPTNPPARWSRVNTFAYPLLPIYTTPTMAAGYWQDRDPHLHMLRILRMSNPDASEAEILEALDRAVWRVKQVCSDYLRLWNADPALVRNLAADRPDLHLESYLFTEFPNGACAGHAAIFIVKRMLDTRQVPLLMRDLHARQYARPAILSIHRLIHQAASRAAQAPGDHQDFSPAESAYLFGINTAMQRSRPDFILSRMKKIGSMHHGLVRYELMFHLWPRSLPCAVSEQWGHLIPSICYRNGRPFHPSIICRKGQTVSFREPADLNWWELELNYREWAVEFRLLLYKARKSMRNHLVMMRMDRIKLAGEPTEAHVVVLDLDPRFPGVYDPNSGFMRFPAGQRYSRYMDWLLIYMYFIYKAVSISLYTFPPERSWRGSGLDA